jgi:hypothetical protein
MTKSVFYLFLLVLFSIFSCKQNAKNQDNNSENTNSANQLVQNPNLKLQIYYFHATHRCKTCNSIENNVKSVLENNYKDQISKGIIDLKVLCVDDEANKALAEKYQAAGASLHLVKIENGIEKDNDLTDFAFSYSKTQPEVFIKGMKDTIQSIIQ